MALRSILEFTTIRRRWGHEVHYETFTIPRLNWWRPCQKWRRLLPMPSCTRLLKSTCDGPRRD